MDENNEMNQGERSQDFNENKNYRNYKNRNYNYNNRNPKFNKRPVKKINSEENKIGEDNLENNKIEDNKIQNENLVTSKINNTKSASLKNPELKISNQEQKEQKENIQPKIKIQTQAQQSQAQTQVQTQAQSKLQRQPQTQVKPQPQLILKKRPETSNINQNNILSKSTDKIVLSVVIPLYNEEESLPELSLILESELNKVANNRWEVIFIDDGSTDKSYEIIKTICSRNRNFKAVRFRTNYGKSAALQIGFQEAKGVIVVTMDADLQDDPAEIPNLINKLKEGYDLVSGWKKIRHDPISKTIPSKFFNFVTSKMSGLKLHDFNCGLKAYRREVVKTVQVYGEMHRYIPALAKWEGFRCTEIPIKHHERRYGKSKYGFSRFIKGFLDLITIVFTTRYFKRPLHFFGTIGTMLALIGFSTDLYLVIEWFNDITYLSNRPLALFGVALIIVGVQLFSFGLIGEMYVKNTLEKANYSIKERI